MRKKEISVDEKKNKVVRLDADFKDIEMRLKKLEKEFQQAKTKPLTNNMTIVVFSGDMDKLLAAFILASSAAAMNINATMFFTFWGITALKKDTRYDGKVFSEKILTLMMPSGPSSAKLSHLNMLGGGKKFFEYLMKKKNIQNLSQCIQMAQAAGVKMVACKMTMDLMGVKREELIDGIEFNGAINAIESAMDSKINLFI